MSELIEFEISDGERKEIKRHFNGETKVALLHRKKIAIFHSNGNGLPKDVSVSTLWVLFQQGYKFVTCFPGIVKNRIGFGEFFFPEHKQISVGSVNVPGKYMIMKAIDTTCKIVKG